MAAPESSQSRSATPGIRRHFKNWISWAGMVLSLAALFAFLFLFLIDLFSGHRNPYVGILGEVVAPLFFLAGVFLIVVGAIWQARRARRLGQEAAAVIDLSAPRDRRLLWIFAGLSVFFLFVTAVGSYKTYTFTESVGFCGQQCHLPMEPEFVAAQHTPHANVECVACHVGPGPAAYLKTKLNGTKQLYHTVRNDFPRPIHVSDRNPRPAQAICEQCHWPSRYIGNIDRTFQHYLSDEKNTPFAVRLLINVGGGDPANGPPGGIHWHMNINNKIEYISKDGTEDKVDTIQWVRSTNPDGVVTEYRTPDFTDDPSKYRIRRMECLDCHSRPAHNLKTPDDAVDIALSTGRLDPNIPFVKQKVMATLVKPYKNKADAEQGITADLKSAFPDPQQSDKIIHETKAIYRGNFFPEMQADWRSYPSNVGHKNTNGCFRCHDGAHVTADGKKSISASDCRSCHIIIAQGDPEKMKQVNPEGYTFFHIDAEFSGTSCTDCHNGGPQ